MKNLTFNQLTCYKGYQKIFTHKSAQLKAGDILQLVGINGCGKTSLLKIIAGLNDADSGTLSYQKNNQTLSTIQFLEKSYYIGHDIAVSSQLSVLENFLFLAQLKQNCQKNQAINALKTIGLSEQIDNLAAHLSAGQKKRIALAVLLVIDCDIWLLDEPFSALDNNTIICIEEMIIAHCKKGGICIFTSHQKPQLLQSKTLLL